MIMHKAHQLWRKFSMYFSLHLDRPVVSSVRIILFRRAVKRLFCVCHVLRYTVQINEDVLIVPYILQITLEKP